MTDYALIIFWVFLWPIVSYVACSLMFRRNNQALHDTIKAIVVRAALADKAVAQRDQMLTNLAGRLGIPAPSLEPSELPPATPGPRKRREQAESRWRAEADRARAKMGIPVKAEL